MLKRSFIVLLALLAAAPCAFALTVKIGSIAPSGSPWDNVLRHLSAQWSQISSGQVDLRIYAGGTAGDESDVIRKMRLGQLQGAALTQLALGRIAPDILALDVPFLITSNDQLGYVMKEMRPYLEGEFSKSGYTMLTWGNAGWVHFFATQKISTPSDLRGLRLGVPAGDEQLLGVWKSLGFNAVAMPIPDIMSGLQSGLIDAFYSPPSATAVFQWFLSAAHMCSLKVVPTIVGLVIDNRTWNKIPEDMRQQMADAALSDEGDLMRIGVQLDDQAVSAMQAQGLTIDPVSPQAQTEWQELGQQGAQQTIGTLFSQNAYDMVTRDLRQFDNRNTGAQ